MITTALSGDCHKKSQNAANGGNTERVTSTTRQATGGATQFPHYNDTD